MNDGLTCNVERGISGCIAVVGCGAWGLALACMLGRHGFNVRVWSESPLAAEQINTTKAFEGLPGAEVPETVTVICDLGEVCSKAEIVIVAVASRWVRFTAESLSSMLDSKQILVSVSKGIEEGSLMTMSEVIEDTLAKRGFVPENPVVALSGPTHAEEVCLGKPSAIVAACNDEHAAQHVQAALSNNSFRIYTSTDRRGVELCGALKNVIALASGIAVGLGYGDNARAALITRGMRELSRLGMTLGCSPDTFSGLAGIGDLVVTATSEQSRNYRAGKLIAQGRTPQESIAEIGQVVEALNVLPALKELIQQCGIDMPISKTVISVINGSLPVAAAVNALMCRPLKAESTNLPVRRVITYGTFDLLHYGHINLLRRARALGTHLIVALSTDEFNWGEKQKKCYFSYAQRKAMLEAIEYVDLVIPEQSWEQKRTDIHEYDIDVFVMGDDWKGKFDFLNDEGCEVVYLPRTPDVSTTQIKNDLGSRNEAVKASE